MDIKRKLELAKQAVNLIARHDEADLAMRDAALDSLVEHVSAEKAKSKARVQEKIEAAIGGQPVDPAG